MWAIVSVIHCNTDAYRKFTDSTLGMNLYRLLLFEVFRCLQSKFTMTIDGLTKGRPKIWMWMASRYYVVSLSSLRFFFHSYILMSFHNVSFYSDRLKFASNRFESYGWKGPSLYCSSATANIHFENIWTQLVVVNNEWMILEYAICYSFHIRVLFLLFYASF